MLLHCNYKGRNHYKVPKEEPGRMTSGQLGLHLNS